MKNINQIKAIEEFNKSYLKLYHSKIVRLNRNIKRITKNNFKKNYRLIKKKIVAKIGDVKIKKNTITIDTKNKYYNFGKPLEGVKVAVYTCITKGYDVAKEPLYLENDTKYFLFTDEISNKYTNWIEKEIDCSKLENEANRYYKFHPDIFDNEYDFAIYIDGNVKVISDVTTLCSIARDSKTGIAMHKHHARDCAYQERIACKYYKRGNQEKINELMNTFRSEGFPERFGLCEATVIVYDLKNPLVKKISHKWWEIYYKNETKRDQIIFPYVIWKYNLTMSDIGDLGNDIWENPKFILNGHD